MKKKISANVFFFLFLFLFHFQLELATDFLEFTHKYFMQKDRCLRIKTQIEEIYAFSLVFAAMLRNVHVFVYLFRQQNGTAKRNTFHSNNLSNGIKWKWHFRVIIQHPDWIVIICECLSSNRVDTNWWGIKNDKLGSERNIVEEMRLKLDFGLLHILLLLLLLHALWLSVYFLFSLHLYYIRNSENFPKIKLWSNAHFITMAVNSPSGNNEYDISNWFVMFSKTLSLSLGLCGLEVTRASLSKPIESGAKHIHTHTRKLPNIHQHEDSPSTFSFYLALVHINFCTMYTYTLPARASSSLRKISFQRQCHQIGSLLNLTLKLTCSLFMRQQFGTKSIKIRIDIVLSLKLLCNSWKDFHVESFEPTSGHFKPARDSYAQSI